MNNLWIGRRAAVISKLQSHVQYFALSLCFAILSVACDSGSNGSSGSSPAGVEQLTGGQTGSEPSGNSGESVSVDLENPIQTSPATLNWPADFPMIIEPHIDAVYVVGLAQNIAYDFDLTLPASIDPGDVRLQVHNVSDNGVAGAEICNGNTDCSGTVPGDKVLLRLIGSVVSAASETYTLSVTRLARQPPGDQGTRDNPLVISLADDTVRFDGSIGAQDFDEGIASGGESFYRLTDLTIGNRYSVAVSSPDSLTLQPQWYYSDDEDVPCDPLYSSKLQCFFTASQSVLDMRVADGQEPYGAAFEIAAQQQAEGNLFEGSWNQPLPLAVPGTDPEQNRVRHYGVADRFSSYYQLTNLDSDRRYKILLSGTTVKSALRLVRIEPVPMGFPVYKPDYLRLHNGDTYIVIENATEIYFRIESEGVEPTRYLLTVEGGARDTSSAQFPVEIGSSGVDGFQYLTTVDAAKFYRLNQLVPGAGYLLQFNMASNNPNYIITSHEQLIHCSEYDSNCTFTAPSDSLELEIIRNSSVFDTELIISLTQTDLSNNVLSRAPFAEQLTLSPAQLPHQGTVSGDYSNYTLTGLVPGKGYFAEISYPSEDFIIEVWPNTDPADRCRPISYSVEFTGCLIRAGSDGAVHVSINGSYDGGRYTIDLQDPLNYSAANATLYQSADTPQIFPDNTPEGVTSDIVVNSDATIESVRVQLLIDHGYSRDVKVSLQAPDGRIFRLAELDDWRQSILTTYSDLTIESYTSSTGYTRYQPSYRPADPFHVLRGTSTEGVWRLRVRDYLGTNNPAAKGGTLLGWAISF